MNYIEPTNRNQYTFATCMNDMIQNDNPVRMMDLIVESIVNTNTKLF